MRSACGMWLFGVVLIAGCAEQGTRPEMPPPLAVPAVFAGVLPCTDCPGIRTELLLREDRVFLLRQTWLGREQGEDSLVDVGRWRWRDDGGAVLLDADSGTRQFGVTAEGSLRSLDRLGQPAEAAQVAELLPTDAGDTFNRPWRWRGMYRQAGDDGLFHDCGSGLTRPVQVQAAFAQLARAYAAARPAPGAWLLVTLHGHLVPVPPSTAAAADEEGALPRETLRVTGVDRAWPGEDCGRREAGTAAVAGLEDTVWWLSYIRGAVLPADSADTPRIRLFAGSDRLESFGGCNAIFGSYVADATSLVFSDVAITYQRCGRGEALERRLVETLRSVDGYTVDGGELLLSAGGEVLARFSAMAPRSAAAETRPGAQAPALNDSP